MRPSPASALSTPSSASSNCASFVRRVFAFSPRSAREFRARHCRAEHTVGFRTRGGAYTMKLNQQGKSLHIEGAVHHRGRRGAHQSGLCAGAAGPAGRGSSKKSWSRVCAAASRPRWTTKRDAIGVVDAINAEDIGKFPDTNLSRGAAAHHRRLHRSPQRRGRDRHGARLRPAVQHGDAQWPADAGGRCVRQWRAHRRRPVRQRDARSISPTSRPSRSARSRSTRPARADIATGGIGASINVRTARPLDNDGLVAEHRRQGAERLHQSRRRRLHAGSLRHLQLRERRQDVRRRASAPATRSATAVLRARR